MKEYSDHAISGFEDMRLKFVLSMRDPLLPPGIKGSNLAFACTKTNKTND